MKTIQHNKIEKYLMERMYGKELEDFKTQIQLDNELAKEVEIQRLMISQIKEIGDLKMRKKLEKIKIDLTKEAPTQMKNTMISSKRIRLSYLVVAASILFLAFSYFTYTANLSTCSQELYSQNYGAYELPFNARSVDVEEALWITAGSFYQEKKYAKAIPLLETVLDQTKQPNAKAQLALGICQMELAQFDKAIQTFKHMRENKDSRYTDHAVWYSAMAFLGSNDLVSSKKLLNEIVKNKAHYFYNQADELLKKME